MKYWLLIVGAIVGLLLGGYQIVSHHPVTTAVESDRVTDTSPAAPVNKGESIDNLKSRTGKDSSTQATFTTEAIDNLAGQGAYTQASPADGYDIEGALIEAETILSNTDVSALKDSRLTTLQEEIAITASVNNAIVERLIDLVKSNPSTDIARFAADILRRLSLPEVHQLGLELAGTASRDAVITGLDLLSTTVMKNGMPAVTAAQSAMNTFPGDDAVLLQAIDVLSTTSMVDVDSQSILDSLSLLVTNPNDAVRSASLFAISNFATDANGMLPVIQALDSDRPDDRVSAAMAIQQNGIISNTLRDTLIARMTDADELWEVRRIAADSLHRFTLTDDQTIQLQNFREEQTRVSQGG